MLKLQNLKLSYLFTTDCGGCKVGFKHPLHYRLHCAIFHDPQCPMKVRKNYSKDIAKPTSIEHEGKGAYQCQYYKMVTTNTKPVFLYLWIKTQQKLNFLQKLKIFLLKTEGNFSSKLNNFSNTYFFLEIPFPYDGAKTAKKACTKSSRAGFFSNKIPLKENKIKKFKIQGQIS